MVPLKSTLNKLSENIKSLPIIGFKFVKMAMFSYFSIFVYGKHNIFLDNSSLRHVKVFLMTPCKSLGKTA